MPDNDSLLETLAPGAAGMDSLDGDLSRTPHLAVLRPDNLLVYFPLQAGASVVLGRSSESDIQVSSDLSVSRRHVRLHLDRPLRIDNLSERSSTWVRGRRLATGEVTALRRGEMFECGSVPMFVQWLAATPAPQPLSPGADAAAPAARSAPPERRERETPMQSLLRLVGLVAPSDASVILQGEVGVGKSFVARRIHELSPRRDKRLVLVNCGAISEKLFEAELFGFDKIMGDVQPKPGLFEVADGGTLLLDEIGEMIPEHQAKLLTVLDTQTVRRVGGTVDRKVNVRVLAATNRDLEAEVAGRRFREDLLSRLNTFMLTVPPLRERIDEILPLARRFLEAQEKKTPGAPALTLSPEAQSWLVGYDWPQNVRELERTMTRAALLCGDGPVQLAHVREGAMRRSSKPVLPVGQGAPPAAPPPAEAGPPLPGDDEKIRRDTLAALEAHYWNVTAAARFLGVSLRTVYNRMEKFGISRPKGPGGREQE